MIMLPAARSGPVEDGEVTAEEITTLLQENGTTTREVLQVKSIVQTRTRHVLPVKLLVYADAERVDIELGVVIDGELSDRHEIELIGLGGAKGLGINVEREPERPLLEPDIEEARIPLQEVTQKRAEQAAVQLNSPAPLPLPAKPKALESQAEEIRAIGVFEHPELLDEALTSARKRILIISPWITGAIVTTAFVGKLERRLQRGVKVDIAYGYDDSENRTDPNAIRRLNNLAARYPEKLHVARLKSNHAKILLFDDAWVTTSFNWLSFKGDPDRTYRVEEGTLIRNRENLTSTMPATSNSLATTADRPAPLSPACFEPAPRPLGREGGRGGPPGGPVGAAGWRAAGAGRPAGGDPRWAPELARTRGWFGGAWCIGRPVPIPGFTSHSRGAASGTSRP